MGHRLRFLVTILVLFCSVLPMRNAQSAPALERGTAITDPYALRELDRGRFGLSRIMLPANSSDAPLGNGRVFALPSMVGVRKALDDEFERYIARHQADLPNETIGVGTTFVFRFFDPRSLFSHS